MHASRTDIATLTLVTLLALLTSIAFVSLRASWTDVAGCALLSIYTTFARRPDIAAITLLANFALQPTLAVESVCAALTWFAALASFPALAFFASFSAQALQSLKAVSTALAWVTFFAALADVAAIALLSACADLSLQSLQPVSAAFAWLAALASLAVESLLTAFASQPDRPAFTDVALLSALTGNQLTRFECNKSLVDGCALWREMMTKRHHDASDDRFEFSLCHAARNLSSVFAYARSVNSSTEIPD